MASGALHAALASLLRISGAQAASVIDGRSGTVVAEVGVGAADDVPALVRLATAAGWAATGAGGLDDLVVTARRAVHVLRESSVPGCVLQVRLDSGRGDVGAARRELASTAVDAAVRAELGVPPIRPGSYREQASGEPGFLSRGWGVGAGPALVAVGSETPIRRSGELAALALGAIGPLPQRTPIRPARTARPSPARAAEPFTAVPVPTVDARSVDARSADTRPADTRPADVGARPAKPAVPGVAWKPSPRKRQPVPEPRETHHPSTPSVLRQAWSTDMETLRRLLVALRRPSERPS